LGYGETGASFWQPSGLAPGSGKQLKLCNLFLGNDTGILK
jgi:hypothetical protein